METYVFVLFPPLTAYQAVLDLAFSVDGARLASCGGDKELKVLVLALP